MIRELTREYGKDAGNKGNMKSQQQKQKADF